MGILDTPAVKAIIVDETKQQIEKHFRRILRGAIQQNVRNWLKGREPFSVQRISRKINPRIVGLLEQYKDLIVSLNSDPDAEVPIDE